MNRTKALWAVAPVIVLLLLAQTCRADSLVAFLPYANTVDSEAGEYNLIVVDLMQESVVEEMEFDGNVRAVDVVDEKVHGVRSCFMNSLSDARNKI